MKNKIIIGNNILYGKIAITEEDHIQGLKFVNIPTVMAFPYNGKIQKRSFWMHETPLPLDILFCRADKIISIEYGVPYCLEHLGNIESDLVIEIPGGAAKKLKINVGNKVLLEESIITVAANYAQILKL